MTEMEMALRRLGNQRLAGNGLETAAEVVGWMGAVQAQDFAMAKWALGQRTRGATEAEIEAAFARGEILRTHGPRPTWHFVTPADARWMLGLLAPRVKAGAAGRLRDLELDEATLKRSQEVFARELEGGKQLTRDELRERLEAARIDAGGQRMPHLLMHAELDGVLISGARKGKQHTYTLLEERVPPAAPRARDEALAELVRRYFTSRGPARIQDFVWWSGLTTADALAGITLNGAGLASEKGNGQTYFFAAESQPAAEPGSSTALMIPVYDEMVVSYTHRAALMGRLESEPPAPRDAGLLQNLLLVDGQAAAGWRRTERKKEIEVEFTCFSELNESEERLTIEAAGRFGAFYGLPARVSFRAAEENQRGVPGGV